VRVTSPLAPAFVPADGELAEAPGGCVVAFAAGGLPSAAREDEAMGASRTVNRDNTSSDGFMAASWRRRPRR